MRIKVILAAAALALAVLVPAVCFRRASSAPPAVQTSQAPVVTPIQTGAPSPARAGFWHGRSADPMVADERGPADPAAPDHGDYVLRRTGELNQLASSGEPGALKTILDELNNADPAIRKAALRAAIDFGSQDAIPALENQIALTDDAREKVDLQKAVDFLQLPKFQPSAPRVSEAAPGE